jgi:transposase-like protein
VVIDGAKALDRAARKVFGAHALVQRCTIHKRRNVTDHLPEIERGWVDAKLVQTFANPDPDAGLRSARELARACKRATLAPPPASGRAWRRCSPSAGSVSPIGWRGR